MSENNLSAKRLYELKTILGMEATRVVEYPLPRPNTDVLDVGINISKYGRAKHILENPDVNQILQSMNAFSTINIYEIDSYVKLGESVARAINYILETQDDSELDEVSKEFIVEADNAMGGMVNKFVGSQMDSKPNMDQEQGQEGGEEQRRGPTGVLDKVTNMFDVGGWIQKLADKLGIDESNLKDMMYAYLFTKMNKGKAETADTGGRSRGGDMQQGDSMGRGQAQFARESVEGTEAIEIEEGVANSGSVGRGKSFKVEEAHENPKQEDVAGPKMPANVKSDVTKRIKELKQLIADYDSEKHFYGEKKPAIFNAKKSLEFIMDKCKSGSMLDFKEAQIHVHKLMGPILDLLPPSLFRYLATGKDDGADKFNNPVN